MSNSETETVFHYIDNMLLPKEIVPVYELVKQYPERISFVKDHNGVKNILFFTTEEASRDIFEVPYFAFLTNSNTAQPSASFTESLYSPKEIYSGIKRFLDTTEETLYIGIGFEECRVTNEDYFEIYYLMEDTKCNVIDAFVSLRRFPDWYSDIADYPFYIIKQNELLNKMAEQENLYLSNEKQKILVQLKKCVEKNDEKSFKELCEQLNNIRRQIEDNTKN